MESWPGPVNSADDFIAEEVNNALLTASGGLPAAVERTGYGQHENGMNSTSQAHDRICPAENHFHSHFQAPSLYHADTQNTVFNPKPCDTVPLLQPISNNRRARHNDDELPPEDTRISTKRQKRECPVIQNLQCRS